MNGQNQENKFDNKGLIYQNNLDEITNLKDRQWKITYYAVLVAGLVFMVVKEIDFQRFPISIFLFVVLIIYARLIYRTMHSLQDRRKRNKKIRDEFFSDEMKIAYGDEKAGHTGFWYDVEILILMGLPLIAILLVIGLISFDIIKLK